MRMPLPACLWLYACTSAPPRIPDDFVWLQEPDTGTVSALEARSDVNDGDLFVLQRYMGTPFVARVASETGEQRWRVDMPGAALRLSGDGHPVVLQPGVNGGYLVTELDASGTPLSSFTFESSRRLVSFAVTNRMAALLTCQSSLCHIEVHALGEPAMRWAKSFVVDTAEFHGEAVVTADGAVAVDGLRFATDGSPTASPGRTYNRLLRTLPGGDLLMGDTGRIYRITWSGAQIWERPVENLVALAVASDGTIHFTSWLSEEESDQDGRLTRVSASGELLRDDTFFEGTGGVAAGRYVYVHVATVGMVALP